MALTKTVFGTTYNTSNPYGSQIANLRDELNSLTAKGTDFFVTQYYREVKPEYPNPQQLRDYLQSQIDLIKIPTPKTIINENPDIIPTVKPTLTEEQKKKLNPIIIAAGLLISIFLLK